MFLLSLLLCDATRWLTCDMRPVKIIFVMETVMSSVHVPNCSIYPEITVNNLLIEHLLVISQIQVHSDSFRINLESFRTFRGLLFQIQIIGRKLFFSFLHTTGSSFIHFSIVLFKHISLGQDYSSRQTRNLAMMM